MSRTSCVGGAILWVTLLAPAPGRAADYWVSTRGSDANDCSSDRPCRTVQRVLPLVSAGDTVWVSGALHQAFVAVGLHGAPGRPITLRAAGRAAFTSNTTASILIRDSSFLTVEGLDVIGGPSFGVVVHQSRFVTIRNGTVRDVAGGGIRVDQSVDVTLERNEVTGSGVAHAAQGVDVVDSERTLIRGNRISLNSGIGLFVRSLGAGTHGVVIDRNYIHSNVAGGLHVLGPVDATIRNNVFYYNRGAGITVEGPRALTIEHNTVHQPVEPVDSHALRLGGLVDVILVRNNILVHARGGRTADMSYASQGDADRTDSGFNVLSTVEVDSRRWPPPQWSLPQWQQRGYELGSLSATDEQLFVSLLGPIYRLKPGSPAVDRGLRIAVDHDIEGTPRPAGGGWDIGAYELAVATPVPTPALPRLSIDDATVSEPAPGGTRAAVFTVSLSIASSAPVSASVETRSGSAIAYEDFEPIAGQLVFPPGTTSLPVGVEIRQDLLPEPPERFSVLLTNPTGATIGDGTGVGTILEGETE